MRINIILLISFGMLFGCGYSKDFKDKANQLIRESKVLSDNVDKANFMIVTRFYNDAQVTFEQIKQLWPENKLIEEKKHLDNAITGTRLLLILWGYSISRSDDPMEPDINSYKEFESYALSGKLVNTIKKDGYVPSYFGKKHYAIDANIKALLPIIKDEFKLGIDGLNKAIN